MSEPTNISRNRRPLVVMAILFGAPLLASFWLYYGSDWRPRTTTANGELIEPARPLPQQPLPLAGGGQTTADWLRDKWTLLVIGDGVCSTPCQQALVYARQTYIGLGRDATRLQRVWLASGHCCDRAYIEREHAGLMAVDAGNAAGQELLAMFPAADRELMIFIVDPLGNLMMRYDSRRDPKGLRTDLKKLLGLSHIG